LACYSLKNFNPIYSPAKSNLTATDFAPKVDFVTGTASVSVAIGDLDGDGKPDLAVVNQVSNTVSVFRNTATSGSVSTGSFATKVDFTTGSSPQSVAIGDLDGDGKPDLAVANNNSATVSVFRNTATSGAITTSSFATKVDFVTGSGPYSVAIGDLDLDGKLDLAIVNQNSASVSVLRNTATIGNIGLGSFAAKVDFTVNPGPFQVAIGDLDGDGKFDLAVGSAGGNNISVLRNAATSGIISATSFETKVDFASSSQVFSVAIGDLDGDGKPDLAVANGNSTASVFRNTTTSGAITAASFATKVDFTTGSSPRSIAIGDLDGDGKLDMVVANNGGASVSVLRNTATSGAIATGSFAAKVDFATGGSSMYVAIGDLDGDGRPDLATANYGASTASVLRNTNNNTNLSSLTTTAGAISPAFATGTTAYSATVSNATTSTIVTPTVADATATVQVQVNGGSYATVVSGTASSALALNEGSNTINIKVTAENGDVKTYILTVTKTQNPPVITSFLPASAKPGDAVTLTGTGFNTTTSNNVVFFGATKATVTAATATSLTVTLPTGATYAPITLLNTESTLACYSLKNFNPIYSPAKSNLTATDFAPKVDFATDRRPQSATVGDLDGDGKPDLVLVNDHYYSASISIYHSTATSGVIEASSFDNQAFFSAGSYPTSVAIGDLDGDGKPDLAVSSYNGNGGSNFNATGTVSVFRNISTSGTINFENKIDFTAGMGSQSVAMGDLDRDGKLDLVVANSTATTISVFKNIGTSGSINFTTNTDFVTGTTPYSVALGDLDGDGKLDIAVANSGSNTVSVFKNTGASGTIGFDAKIDYTTDLQPHYIAIGDLDDDGKLDLVSANSGSASVSVLKNTGVSGSLGFASKVDFITSSNAQSVALGDLDGDTKLDLAVANDVGVSVFRNTATSGIISTDSFATKVDFATGSNPYSVAIGDLDGDAKPDLAVTNSVNAGSIALLRNTNINVTNNNTNLSSLTTTAGAISPAFATGTTAYTATVSNATTSTIVTPTVADATATVQVQVNGGSYATVVSGTASSALALNEGSNTINIKVTAENGDVKTYILTVCRTIVPTFTAIAPLCSGNTFTLPTTSNNGVTGTWLPAKNTTATTTYTFSPDAAQCVESVTLTVTINSTPAPTVSAQTFCNTATVANLLATGTAIKWYAAATLGTALVNTTALSTATYYVPKP
jgi:hypothetical protein